MKKALNVIICGFCWILGLSPAGPITKSAEAQQTYDIVHQVEADQTLHVKTQVQYLGSVIADGAGQQENARVVPLDVRGQFIFDQRISNSSKKGLQAIRYFDRAVASIKAGENKSESTLSDNNKLVLARIKVSGEGSNQFQIASIAGALRQKEYELLKNPADPLSFTGLFNKQGIAVGDKWNIEKDQIAGLLAFDRVVSSSVKMLLKSVDSGVAKIYIFGKARGEVDDARTDVSIKAIAKFDLTQQIVTALRLSVDEERRPGSTAPGFEGKVKLDTQIARTTPNVMLSKSRLAQQYKGKKIKFSFLFDKPDNGYQIYHDTNWRVIASESDEAVFRLLDGNDLIAQCNIAEMPKRPDGTPLALSQFQDEVRRIISKSEAKITDADRTTNANGYETLRVAVDGVESEIPFVWLYYHIASKDGRRLTMVFTVEKEAVDLLGMADRTLVNNVTFKQPRQAVAPNSGQAATR